MVDTKKPLQIESDTSEYATGAVLSMLQDDGVTDMPGLIYICDVLLVGLNVHMEYYVKNNLYPSYT